jgi:ATP-binding cassette, subfamily C, bacterial CydD
MLNRNENTPTDAALLGWLGEQKALIRNAVSASVGLGLLSGLLLIIQAWYLGQVIEGVIIRHLGISRVMPWMWVLLAVFAVRAILVWLSHQAAFLASARIKKEIRNALFRHLQALGPEYLYGRRTGDLANTVVDAVEALEPYYARYLPQLSLAALIPLAMLAVVTGADWHSALVLAIGGPLIPFFMVVIGKGAERLNQKQWQTLARLSAHFLDVLQGLTTLKLFNASRQEARVVAQMADDYRRSVMSVLRVAFLSSLALEFFSTLGIAMVAVLLGFRLLSGHMDFLPAILVLLLAPEFFLPLRKLGVHYHARMEAIGAAQGILEILNTPAPARAKGTKTLNLARGLHVAVENVRFAYDGNRVALSDLNLHIHPGETLALVGHSGAGKSTLAHLLLDFLRPQAGSVTVNGTALSELAEGQWLPHVAWVPQRPHMVDGTILENIRLGRPAAGMPQVVEAARRAQAEAFIRKLPRGYDTPVGEDGHMLSGGQRQLIALARAFLRDAPLVILDEATANLDPQTQEQVIAAIAALARGRTALMIAHRLSTVQIADRIVVLHQGKVVEAGTHGELLDLDGAYARMVGAYGRTA